MTPRYEVIVGNVGTVYDGFDFSDARDIYAQYKRLSKGKHGRAAGESVTLMQDGEPKWEWVGRVDRKKDA